MQRFDLENYHLVTGVPTKCATDSVYLSVYLTLSFPRCQCLSPWAGERPASRRDPPVSPCPHSQVMGMVGWELCRESSPIAQANAQTFPRHSRCSPVSRGEALHGKKCGRAGGRQPDCFLGAEDAAAADTCVQLKTSAVFGL